MEENNRPKSKLFEPLDNRKKSIGHEKRLAKTLGGKTVNNSGANFRTGQDRIRESGVRTDHADIYTDDFKIEHKFTKHKSMSLKLEWLNGIKTSAKNSLKFPALAVTFDCEDLPDPEDWVMIPLHLFKQLSRKK
jgi:hypothetical protein